MAFTLKARGWFTYRNDLTVEGSLIKADNIVIDEDGVIEPRRGFNSWGDALPISTDRIKQLLTYKNRVFRHVNNELQFDSDGNGTFLTFDGIYNELDSGLRLKFVESNSNFYFTTSDGIKKISASAASEFTTAANYITSAGAPRGIDFDVVLDGTVGFLEPNQQVAYRVVWGTKDKNENLILGAPSSRSVITNIPTTTAAVSFSADLAAKSVTFQDAGNTVTFSGFTPATNDQVYFSMINSTTGITTNTPYYIINISGSTFQLSVTPSGSVIDLVTDGSGTMIPIKSYITLASHGYSNGDMIYFSDISTAVDFNLGTKYYVVNAATNTFQLSTEINGDYITITEDGTGTIVPLSANPSTDVKLTIQIPSEVNSNYFIQVYRTAAVSLILPYTTIEDSCGDEMYLVDERNYDGITNPFEIVDSTLEIFRESGTLLYTNQVSGEGILQANYRPPIAKDLALFRGSTFYANTKTFHRLSFSLISAIGLDTYTLGIGNSNVVRLYVFEEYDSSTDPNPSTTNLTGGIIGVDTGGSPAQNIDTTARNLVRIINQDSSNPVSAFYTSTDTTLPGMIDLENDSVVDEKFYLCVNNSAIKNKFNPELPVITIINTTTIITSNIFSDNEVSPNRIYYSKYYKPEAVPIVNFFDVGPRDKAIHRIVALRDSLFVLKEDGVYIVTGSTAPNFSVRLLDATAPIIAPDSAAILNNKIYCLSLQGIIAISETGVDVISRPIEDKVRDATKPGMNFEYTTFGVGYESDRSYLLWLPELTTDDVATQCFRYNTFTDTWVRWTISATSGLLLPSESRLYLGDANKEFVLRERKDISRTDYADYEYAKNILSSGSVQGDELILQNVNNITIGDALYQKQYVTISFYNRLLRKLDLDPGLTYSLASGGIGYITLEMQAGDWLYQKLTALNLMLQSDPTIGTYTPVTFSNDFITMQTELNTLIDQLNSSITGTIHKNFRHSENDVYYEATVLNVNTFTNRVLLSEQMPWIYSSDDNLIIYKAVLSDVIWSPQHFDAPDQLKQIHEGTLIFSNNNFYSATVSFQSDLSRGFDNVDFYGRGIGVWGLQNWGEFNWGGIGSDAPFRTLIPKEKQRCRYLSPRFKHTNARNKFRLLGISLTPRVISTRGYR